MMALIRKIGVIRGKNIEVEELNKEIIRGGLRKVAREIEDPASLKEGTKGKIPIGHINPKRQAVISSQGSGVTRVMAWVMLPRNALIRIG